MVFKFSPREPGAPFYIKGVNLGVALPGKFPSEFPTDSATYSDGVGHHRGDARNTVRVYTILPPTFYRAPRGWNLSHPKQALWLIHGVWTELPPVTISRIPPGRQVSWAEMSAVDLLHGANRIPVPVGTRVRPLRRGCVAAGCWPHIIGREWEPFAVKEFDAGHPDAQRSFRADFSRQDPAPAVDVWMAEQ